jgi:hypothetical protein
MYRELTTVWLNCRGGGVADEGIRTGRYADVPAVYCCVWKQCMSNGTMGCVETELHSN